ncbi:hypothetical protein KTD22_06575 [Burkholderia multivorans]|uniref:hypothetical protein n=1 Tax=Burkholderia multivorans TaxID=87883 RepID=UPI001C23DBFF|nr:hypothetical protein [Burkholderia multivorans]MBU9226289.1 hypothetical protein [Burkholderia multivorans]
MTFAVMQRRVVRNVRFGTRAALTIAKSSSIDQLNVAMDCIRFRTASPMRAADRGKRGDTSGYALDAGVTNDRDRHRAGGTRMHASTSAEKSKEKEKKRMRRANRPYRIGNR